MMPVRVNFLSPAIVWGLSLFTMSKSPFLRVSRQGLVQEVRYWQPHVNLEFSSRKSDQEYAEEFRALFKKVVRRHLLTDVPLGVTLSGGLDSSGIAAMTAQLLKEGTSLHTGNRLHTFSAL